MKALAPRFETGLPMLMAGLRRTHAFADASRGLPLQWSEFVTHLPMRHALGDVTYGVMCGSDMTAQTFEYLAGMEVSTFDGLAGGLDRMRIPQAHYAVFTHEGQASTISQTWGAIWNSWLPGSGWASAPSPDFERYDDRFDPATGAGIVEIWFPVMRPAG